MTEAKKSRRRPKSEPVILPGAFRLTDYGNAERMIARYRGKLRFCPPRRRWLVWDDRRWAWDETGVVARMAKRTVRGLYEEAAKCSDDDVRRAMAKHASASETASRIAAMVQLASTEPGVAVMPDELDADAWALNVLNGTLDLRAGQLRPHDAADLITKLAPVEYCPDARHELWEQFLVDATGGDAELEGYLRRIAGYALTGVATEKSFFLFHGPPDTGKSTFLAALESTLGDYHASADFSTWCTQTSTGGNRGDLVRLAGARLVSSVEVAKGKRFDEAIMKRVTGGDALTAAAKYEAEVTFRASFTLVLAANDAPAIHDDDEGAWSRVKRIPLMHVVPAEKRDPRVRETLRDPSVAGPAILAWAMRGLTEWRTSGLGTAAAVEASTKGYRGEMDRLAGFLTDCCAFEGWDECSVPRTVLRDAYKAWCAENDVRRPISTQDFAKRLREAGAIDGKSNGVRVWKRVRLLKADEEPATGAAQGHQGHAGSPVSGSPTWKTQSANSPETAIPSDPDVPPRPRQVSLDPDSGELREVTL